METPKLVRLNKIFTKEQQETVMLFIEDKAWKRRHFESENLLEYIYKIGLCLDRAYYLIGVCLGFEYIENLLNTEK